MIYLVRINRRVVIIADIMIDKIISQLSRKDRLQKRKRKHHRLLQKREKGRLLKRSDKIDSKPSVGDQGSITKKENKKVPPSTGKKGTITKSPGGNSSDVKPKSSIKTPPKNTSPPKTRVGGAGKITKRR